MARSHNTRLLPIVRDAIKMRGTPAKAKRRAEIIAVMTNKALNEYALEAARLGLEY